MFMRLRGVVGLLAMLLLLLGSSGDAFGLHRCSHHDALPTADEAPQHNHHGHNQAPADDEPVPSCTCVGACATNGVALTPAVSTAAIDVVATTFVVPASVVDIIPAAQPAFLLPYSTAPPASL